MRPALTALAVIVAASAIAAVSVPARSASEALALQQLQSPVSQDETLATFIGSWNGEGVVKQSSAGADEPVKCRLSNGWTAENKLMKMQLSCRGIDYQFSATGYIGRSGSTYHGSMSSSVSGEANVSGRKSGGGLSFTMVSNSKEGISQSNLSIRVNGGAVTNTVQRTDPETGKKYTALNVVMRR